jgi:hypothetical protein
MEKKKKEMYSEDQNLEESPGMETNGRYELDLMLGFNNGEQEKALCWHCYK